MHGGNRRACRSRLWAAGSVARHYAGRLLRWRENVASARARRPSDKCAVTSPGRVCGRGLTGTLNRAGRVAPKSRAIQVSIALRRYRSPPLDGLRTVAWRAIAHGAGQGVETTDRQQRALRKPIMSMPAVLVDATKSRWRAARVSLLLRDQEQLAGARATSPRLEITRYRDRPQDHELDDRRQPPRGSAG